MESGQSDDPDDHKMVQLELEPEIIEPQEAPQRQQVSPAVKSRKAKKDKQKPILINKDEKPLVKVGSFVVGLFLIFRSL